MSRTDPPRRRRSRLSLNATREGLNHHIRRHPLVNTLAVLAFACGILAFVTGLIVRAHVTASWVGLIGVVEGLSAQLISVTTAERMVIVVGVTGSAVGLGLGLAHGGFAP